MNTEIQAIANQAGVSAEALTEATEFIIRRLEAMPDGLGIKLMQENPERVMQEGFMAWYEVQRKLTDEYLANPSKYMPAILAELSQKH